MSQDNNEKTITLYSQQGSSDKVYMLQISKIAEGEYILNYANAKRGQALNIQQKGTATFTLEAANKEFDKVII
jgi:hypothetical protein